VGTADGRRGPGVAFVVQGDQVVVYVCDGKKRGDWFGGRVADGRFDLETEDGTHVVGRVSSNRVTGTLAVAGGLEQRFTASPSQDRPSTGLYVFDDPAKKGYKARWIITRSAVHGISSTTTGTTTNAIRVTTSTSSTGDTRVSGVSSELVSLLEQQNALKAELQAATSENVSLRETLAAEQQRLSDRIATTTTGTSTTK
jgi:hypothetical protein